MFQRESVVVEVMISGSGVLNLCEEFPCCRRMRSILAESSRNEGVKVEAVELRFQNGSAVERRCVVEGGKGLPMYIMPATVSEGFVPVVAGLV